MKNFLLLISLAVACAVSAQAPLHQVWSRTIEVQATPKGAALDNAGNTLVALDHTSKFTLAKFGPSGTLLWQREYPASVENTWIQVQIVGADPTGNFYLKVTERSRDRASLAKIDPSGNVLWSRTFGRQIQRELDLYAALGPNGVVLGSSAGTDNLRFESYDFDGNLLWTRLYDSTGADRLRDMLVDPNGNLFGVGTAHKGVNFEQRRVFLIKYSVAGVRAWTNFVEGLDYVESLAADKEGNSYFARGLSYNDGVGIFPEIYKYKPDGSLAWVQTFTAGRPSGAGNGVDSIVVADSGGVFAMARFAPNYETDPTHYLLRYSQTGVLDSSQQLPVWPGSWMRSFTLQPIPGGVQASSEAAFERNPPDNVERYGVALYRFNLGGSLLFRYFCQGESSYLVGASSAVDPQGGTSVVGRSNTAQQAVYRYFPSSFALSLVPSSLIGGSGATASVELASPAPAGGANVNLSTNSSSIQVPQTVVIPAGAKRAGFTVRTGEVGAYGVRTITAVYNGATRSVRISLTPTIQRVTVTPNTTVGGQTPYPVATVHLTGAAGPAPFTTVRTWSDGPELFINNERLLPPGSRGFTFTVANKKVTSTVTRTIYARVGNKVVSTSITLTP